MEGTQNATPNATAPTEGNADAKAQGGAAPAGSGQAPATSAGGAQGNAVKEAAAEAVRKHKLKIDGQEVEVDDEELKRGYSHQKAANKKLQEGLKAKKQAEEFVKMMRDPDKLHDALKGLGYTDQQIREVAEKRLAAYLEDDMLDPKEKELRQREAKLKAYEEQQEKLKKDAERQRDEALKKKYSEEYSNQFIDALKTTGLPPTKEMVGKMAQYIARAAGLNFEMTAVEAAKLVREDLELVQKSTFSAADAETLVRLIGEEGLQKLRGFDTARLKDPNANLKTPPEQGERKPREKGAKERMTPQQWREFNRK